MAAVTNITIHPSQFPDAVRAELLTSLRNRAVNHKFHYDSVRQTQKWLDLHEAFSPARTDPDCLAIYDRAFEAVSQRVKAGPLQLIGLGCGGGKKDTRLLHLLKPHGANVAYAPVDTSTAMVLVARNEALSEIPPNDCHPLVCDLATAADLPAVLNELLPRSAVRLITFFGMIPNFAPEVILPRLASVVGVGDWLLFSANLAPGPDYAAGVQKILPLYDNTLTRDWLMTFLRDVGVDPGDGDLRFCIEDDASNDLKRVAAYFHFTHDREITVDGERFGFHKGDGIRLFFSYRHTPNRIRDLLARQGLRVEEQWLTPSEEEGVFLVRKE